ncbi:MAG: hypothetical protein ACPGRW_06390 [Flavobacteriaceae bacterium]
MIHIYAPSECPKWIKDLCEKGHLSKSDTRYTTYEPSSEIVYYVVYKKIPVSTVLHICQELDTQMFKHDKLQ